MALTIRTDDVHDPEVIAFLEAHVTQMRSISPPESVHALDVAGLRRPEITFFVARDESGGESGGEAGAEAGGELLGTAALKDLGDGHLELKSMRTAPHRRGEGIGAQVLAHVLDHARTQGAARISLETGAENFFAPARSLYRRHGFVDTEPFADYAPDPLSTFLTLRIDATPR
ncbi:GNAT family N-acetyltransferase [Nocardioides bruguierae]|uniref:GNAT family N-acetyltransferase n=1 Tax=Nocardioides bruguierae TaxID=2945102 RepID=UPI002022932C|nr:GNAT family N-acetyltransferase [Nocardioides bruguierae]MCL8025431.1 GNAT family N-acetyltransferase [Nocardioides bruguierae]